MMQFVAKVRDLSGGKPVGLKLCLGKRREFLAVCKAMLKTGITPDYISIDGGEGGTGAAPLEFSNYVGMPGVEGLVFVHNALVGVGLREKIKLFTSGKVTTAFEVIKRLSIGADVIYSARGMMMALGCIQALRCNSNACPTGVATQDPHLIAGLHVPDKRKRVTNFHRETIRTLAEMLGAMGLVSTAELRPWHIFRRVDATVIKHYGEIYEYLENGSLLKSEVPSSFARAYQSAVPDSFRHREQLQIVS
jgi:glutamate synthase domain-containing protein 2